MTKNISIQKKTKTERKKKHRPVRANTKYKLRRSFIKTDKNISKYM